MESHQSSAGGSSAIRLPSNPSFKKSKDKLQAKKGTMSPQLTKESIETLPVSDKDIETFQRARILFYLYNEL